MEQIDVKEIIRMFGGVAVAARKLDLSTPTVRGWIVNKDIPYKHRVKIWQALRKSHLIIFPMLFPELAAAQNNEALIECLQNVIKELKEASTKSAPNT